MRRFGLVVLLLSPVVARAHFALLSPPNWMTQAADGSPQKAPPCGNEGGGTATGIITTFTEGQTIPVQINEIVFHPGHYRIAIAADQASLPAEPGVDAGGGMACGYANITNPPYSLPIVADDVFDHVAPFGTPQTAQIKLPDGFTCTNCTLQIIEFMSDHGLNPVGGCFYHHCAQVTIVPADGGSDAGSTGNPDSGLGSPDSGSTGSPDSGSTGGQDSGNPGGPDAGSGNPDGGGGPGGTSTGSCGCTGGAGSASLALFGLALLGGAASRRSRRRAH
jgi:MYXO-CTERM domain-containing protein